MLELGGYASRVHQMFSVFADCAKGNFTRMQARALKSPGIVSHFKLLFTRMQAGGVEKAVSFNGGDKISIGDRLKRIRVASITSLLLTTSSSIVLRGVPIKTPNGDTLVESMQLTVRAAVASRSHPQLCPSSFRCGREITHS